MPAIASTANSLSTRQVNTSQPQPRLVHAAREFEAQMMKELLKPMTGSDALLGDEEGLGREMGIKWRFR